MADTDTSMTDSSTPTVPSPSCPFQKVPLEVLLRITYFLTTPELGNVRLTCRSIEQSLYTTFTNEFFTRKQFMLSDDSLQALTDIAKSRLGSHLRMVHFGLDRYPPTMQGHGDEERDMKLIQRHADMFTLWSTGYHRDMLAEAFRNLASLEDVVIRDFNSNKRSRDGPFHQWTSYGSTTGSTEANVRMSQQHNPSWSTEFSANFSSQVLAAVLMALGQAQARPKGIEVMSRKGSHLRNFAFNIPSYMEASVLPVVQNLEKLHIDIDTTEKTIGLGLVSARPPAAAGFMLRKFLLNATNLRCLRINEIHSEKNGGVGGLLQWMAKPSTATPALTVGCVPAIAHPAFAQLEELNLGQMSVEASWVLNLVRKLAPSLKRLELWRLKLLRTLPDTRTHTQLMVNFWAKFFQRLRDIPGLDLRHIKAGNLEQLWRTRPSTSSVLFNNGKETVIIYTGTDWKHFMGEVLSNMVMQYAPEEHVPHGEGGDDNSDGDWDLYALDL